MDLFAALPDALPDALTEPPTGAPPLPDAPAAPLGILHPDTPGADPAAFGGKARALLALRDAGLPIPPWFVVTPAACPADLQPGEALRRALDRALAELGNDGTRFAVRSSALDEDGGEHSFAGQLDSFLFVAPEDVADRVADVWRSAFSERLEAYRRERRLGPPQAPAVLIQRMVWADSAGVAFSVDPVSGRWDRAVVSGVFGLGTALVGGEDDGDTWRVDRLGRICDREVRPKHAAHRFDPRALEGVASVPLAPAAGQRPSLEDEQVLAVAALARACARHFGRPQDIEWAFEQGEPWLLQSRPVTTLAHQTDPDGRPALWDNSNIAESYGGLTTPLTYSFARRAYEEVYRQFSRLMGVDEARIEAHRDTFRGMIGLVRGRVYYNLLAWYRVLALLPGFQLNRGFMEQMMGVKSGLPEAFRREFDTRPSLLARIADGGRLLRSLAGLGRAHLGLPRQIDRFYARLDEALAPPTVPLDLQRPDELAAHYRDLERRLLTRWDAPLVNDFFAMIFYGLLRKGCVRWCEDGDGTLQNDLVGGEGGMVSAEPAGRVRALAELVRQDPALAERLRTARLPEIRRALEAHPEVAAAFRDYLDTFGDRCLEELKLESPTLEDDPTDLYRAVGHFAARETTGQEGHATVARRDAEARVTRAFEGRPLRRRLFRWILRQARARVRDRENLRFERTRLFGRVRRIFLELGRRFHAAGLLDDPRDVFWLEVEEALGFVEGTATCPDLRGLAALRRRAFEGFRQEEPPADRFATFGWVHHGQDLQWAPPETAASPAEGSGEDAGEAPEDPAWVRQGLGCCPGEVRGPVRVVRDPRGVALPAGTILVAERTDPGWIMLFPAAAGLLVERGSLLSHSAIVARELGLPAVVSVPGLTGWLKDGDWVAFDGRTGRIQRLEGPDAQ